MNKFELGTLDSKKDAAIHWMVTGRLQPGEEERAVDATVMMFSFVEHTAESKRHDKIHIVFDNKDYSKVPEDHGAIVDAAHIILKSESIYGHIPDKLYFPAVLYDEIQKQRGVQDLLDGIIKGGTDE